jgi:hypothetical protein
MTQNDLDKILKRGYVKVSEDSASRGVADSQSSPGHEPVAAKEAPRFDRPVSVHITSYRHRLADTFGCSEKYAIDAIVDRGILQDDSTKEINEKLSHQEQIKIPKSQEEETVIIITEIGDRNG